MSNRTLATAFASWRQLVEDHRRLRDAARAVIVRMMSGTLSRSWNAWRDAVEAKRTDLDVMWNVLQHYYNRWAGG